MHGCDRSRSIISVHSATIRFTAGRELKGTRRLTPDQQSKPVRPEQEAGVLDLLVHAGGVETEVLDQLRLRPQGVGGGAGEMGLRPVALAEHRTDVVRPVVEQEHAPVHREERSPR